jgi:hypothetical protein
MTLFLGAVLVLTAGALLYDRLPPSIPAGAAATPVAHVAPGAEDASSEACLDRLGWGSGWADLCWQAYRITSEADDEKDYYTVRFYGSYAGVRWLVARIKLDGQPAGGAFIGWPIGTYQGACVEAPVDDLPAMPAEQQTVCGRTDSMTHVPEWFHELTWRCERCLLPDATTRGVFLLNTVGVTEGTIPSWDLYAEGGS